MAHSVASHVDGVIPTDCAENEPVLSDWVPKKDNSKSETIH